MMQRHVIENSNLKFYNSEYFHQAKETVRNYNFMKRPYKAIYLFNHCKKTKKKTKLKMLSQESKIMSL